MKIFNNKKVIILGAGSSIRKYNDYIYKYLDKNKSIIIGCKNIGDIVVPDYHCWFDEAAFERDSKISVKKGITLINKNSIPVFLKSFDKNLIKKYWDGYYKTISCKFISWKHKNSSPKYINGKFSGAFVNTGCLAIFWAFCMGASKIEVLGMDGYTFYSEEDLIQNKESQHCSGDGNTFFRRKNYSEEEIKNNINLLHEKLRYKDNKILRTLSYFKNEYKMDLRILTPTYYKLIYDNSVLGINDI